MVLCSHVARAQFVSDMARRTVWIRQKTDGRWEAIDWHGGVIAEGKYRSTIEYDVKQMASHDISNIYAIAVIVEPRNRQPKRRPKGMRRIP